MYPTRVRKKSLHLFEIYLQPLSIPFRPSNSQKYNFDNHGSGYLGMAGCFNAH